MLDAGSVSGAATASGERAILRLSNAHEGASVSKALEQQYASDCVRRSGGSSFAAEKSLAERTPSIKPFRALFATATY